MSFKIIRNDITKMNVNAVVNTADKRPLVGDGCDKAIYMAAGYEQLMKVRKQIGDVPEGESFLTEGYNLPADYIIHTVSPKFIDGNHGEEELLRNCYRNSLKLANEKNVKDIAFPLISTGSFGYSKEEGMRIAIDEINNFLFHHSMTVYLVVFDEKSTAIGESLFLDLETYIDTHYVEKTNEFEYADEGPCDNTGTFRSERTHGSANIFGGALPQAVPNFSAGKLSNMAQPNANEKLPKDKGNQQKGYESEKKEKSSGILGRLFGGKQQKNAQSVMSPKRQEVEAESCVEVPKVCSEATGRDPGKAYLEPDFNVRGEEPQSPAFQDYTDAINKRMQHLADTFQQYLFYLIEVKGMKNEDVWKKSIVDRKLFSKIKNDPDYHPKKITAMCLCVGLELNLDETKDLLARAGYALSPCDKTDIIFSYFIENKVYDMIEIDIELENHGLTCLIS